MQRERTGREEQEVPKSKGFFEKARNKIANMIHSGDIDLMTSKELYYFREDLEKVFNA